jgi:hypothetical protein
MCTFTDVHISVNYVPTLNTNWATHTSVILGDFKLFLEIASYAFKKLSQYFMIEYM